MQQENPNIPDTYIVREINPTARVYGIEITDILIMMGAIPVILMVVWVSFPPLDIPVDIAGYFGGTKLPDPPSINLIPWLPGGFIWLGCAAIYLEFRRNKLLYYLKDFWKEVNEATGRVEGINPNIWEMGPDFEIEAYEIEDEAISS
jgi:hypothetical protein